MQTRPYSALTSLIEALIGATLTLEEHRHVLHLVNRRFQEAYNTTQFWPRYLVSSEERTLYTILTSGLTGSDTQGNSFYSFIGNDANGNAVYKSKNTDSSQHFIFSYLTSSNKWRLVRSATSTISISSSDVVTFAVAETLCLSSTTNDDSPTDVESWDNQGDTTGTLATEKKLTVLYDDAEGNDIAEFLRIHRKKAFLNQSQLEYEFFLDANGANILNVANTTDNNTFVTYKKRFDVISITETSPTPVVTDYTGDTSAIPLEFFYYLAHTIYADFLRIERKYEEALAEETRASQILAQELEKIDIIANNNSLRKSFTTHINRQSR